MNATKTNGTKNNFLSCPVCAKKDNMVTHFDKKTGYTYECTKCEIEFQVY